MDFSKLSFAEFCDRLSRKGVKELRKMGLAYRVALPASLEDKDVILRTLYEGLTGSEPASAVESLDAPSSSPSPAEAGPRILLQSRTGFRYWIEPGVKLMPVWKDFPLSLFTPSELEALKKDRNVGYKDVPVGPGV